jgi:putative transposase
MRQLTSNEHPCFFTATINGWSPLLLDQKYKNIIIESLQFLVHDNRIVLHAFVIMSNHIHFIWQPLNSQSVKSIQASFLKYTGNMLAKQLVMEESGILYQFESKTKDRKYHIWKRKSLSIELFNRAPFDQKLIYIHSNPVAAKLCEKPEQYYYSSAKFYLNGIDDFGMLTHYE